MMSPAARQQSVSLAAVLGERMPAGCADLHASGLEIDSRRVRPGDAFVAVRGDAVDGHRFIAAALEAGASAIVAEEPAPGKLPAGTDSVLVPDTREALGTLAATCGARSR